MSYRSIKSVLGETHLERKCRFLFGACLFVLITGSFWYYGFTTEKLVYQQNRERGRLLVDTIMTVEHFEKLENTEDFRNTMLTRLIKDMRTHEYEWEFLRPQRGSVLPPTADAYERDLWQRFADQGPPPAPESEAAALADQPYYAERYRTDAPDKDGQPHSKYEYYQPVYAKNVCINCHRTLDASYELNLGSVDPPANATARLREGDLMAIVKVRIDNAGTVDQVNWNRAILLAFAIVTVFLAMIVAYVIVKYVIVKPLKHLTRVSDEVTRGNIDQRAEIHTGDEFEALAVAFNRMLRHLVDAQQELRHLNTDLDQKVDQLAQANMQLFEANRLKSDFLALMGHELRTPLNSIIGFSDVLGSIDALDDKQKRYVQNIKNSGKQLLDMVNDILDLYKIESGKFNLRLVDFRLPLVIGAQCDWAMPLSDRRNIDLEIDVPPNLPPLHQDQGKVQQILNNLLSNAIKFTPEGGRIRITAQHEEPDWLVLSVADTGIGIAEEDQKLIFEKFRQGKTVLPGGDTMTREYSGTGLGLSIVKELCKLLGGEITVTSELGKGSVFTVRLPWRLPDRPEPDPLDPSEISIRPRTADMLGVGGGE